MREAQKERDRVTIGLDLYLKSRGTYRYLNRKLNNWFNDSWLDREPGTIIRLEAGPQRYQIWALCEKQNYMGFYNTFEEADAMRVLKSYPQIPYIEVGHLGPGSAKARII